MEDKKIVCPIGHISRQVEHKLFGVQGGCFPSTDPPRLDPSDLLTHSSFSKLSRKEASDVIEDS